jgi:hypothetical protein
MVTCWPHDEHRNVRLSYPGSAGSIAASTAMQPHFGHDTWEASVPEEGASRLSSFEKPRAFISSLLSLVANVTWHKIPEFSVRPADQVI